MPEEDKGAASTPGAGLAEKLAEVRKSLDAFLARSEQEKQGAPASKVEQEKQGASASKVEQEKQEAPASLEQRLALTLENIRDMLWFVLFVFKWVLYVHVPCMVVVCMYLPLRYLSLKEITESCNNWIYSFWTFSDFCSKSRADLVEVQSKWFMPGWIHMQTMTWVTQPITSFPLTLLQTVLWPVASPYLTLSTVVPGLVYVLLRIKGIREPVITWGAPLGIWVLLLAISDSIKMAMGRFVGVH